MHGLAAAAETVACSFVIRRLGKQPHRLFHVAKPPVGTPPLFAGQAARVEYVPVPDIVGGQREARPFLYGYIRIKAVDQLRQVLYPGVDILFGVVQFGKSQLVPGNRHDLHQPASADPASGLGIEFGLLVHLRGNQAPILTVLAGVFFHQLIIGRQAAAQIDPQRILRLGDGALVFEVPLLHHVKKQAAFFFFYILVERCQQGRIVLAHRPSQGRRLDAKSRLELPPVGEFHVEQIGVA